MSEINLNIDGTIFQLKDWEEQYNVYTGTFLVRCTYDGCYFVEIFTPYLHLINKYDYYYDFDYPNPPAIHKNKIDLLYEILISLYEDTFYQSKSLEEAKNSMDYFLFNFQKYHERYKKLLAMR